MRLALLVFLLGSIAHAAHKDVRGRSRFLVNPNLPGQVYLGDNGFVGMTKFPMARAGDFDWSKLNGKWLLAEVAEGEKFQVTLDFAYLKNCGAVGGVREHNGTLATLTGWTYLSESGANLYSFFSLGGKYGRLEVTFKETGDVASTQFTIISDNEEYLIPATLTRVGDSEMKAHDTNMSMSAPPLIFEEDSYYVEHHVVPAGVAFHPKIPTALTCFAAPGMGFFNPNVPEMIVTLSKGQASGSYLIAIVGASLVEKENGATVISAASKDQSFWARWYK